MRRAVALLCTCLVAASCGGRSESLSVPPDRPSGATRQVALPDPIPAVAAFRVHLHGPVPDTVSSDLEDVPGVAIVSALATERFRVRGPGGTETLELGSTKPLRFRSVAPASTKEAEFVWTALLGGRSVLTSAAARTVGIEGSGEIRIGDLPIPVGAFASNGTPELVDVLVADHIGRDLGLGDPNMLVVGAEAGADIDRISTRLRDLLRDLDVDVERVVEREPAPIEPADQPEPVGRAEGTLIGSMSFRILEDGFIEPDPAWVAANIASADVALLGNVTCHRLVLPQLHAAMVEIAEAGLAAEVDPAEYGGCYVARFIDRDPHKPLSMHAFGLAFDINVSTNHLGTAGDQHPKVIEILARWGFAWGGTWGRPDPMHFELARLVET